MIRFRRNGNVGLQMFVINREGGRKTRLEGERLQDEKGGKKRGNIKLKTERVKF